jgi:hypothetical protein
MPAATAIPPLAKRRPDVPVEVLAARTLSLATLGPRRRAERRKESVVALEALAGASLLELRQKLPTRYWVVGMLSLMGKSTREIAALVGYAGSAPVVRVLRHPAVLRLVQEVRNAQLEAVVAGTYGVAAAARAAAPAVIEHVAALAGGVKDRATGERVGRAKRDADALRGAELLLTVSGDKMARTATTHVNGMLEEFSDSELEALAERGEIPDRYQGVAGLFGAPTGADLLTPVDASESGPVSWGARPAGEKADLPRTRRERMARARALRGPAGMGQARST